MRNGPFLLLPGLLLGACTSPPRTAKAPDAGVLPPATVQAPAWVKSPAAEAPLVAPKHKKPGPIPTRALNAQAECSFRDESGYNGAMKLAVVEARVNSFEANVNIPQRGTCRFDLRDFRQTRELPNVELSHRQDRCIVRVWEQGERVTVAFQQCQKMCSGDAWEYLWPILTDRRNGSCA